ncbi:2-succinyl-6-hydroxy-2,4-cyclohexadiene-1-carboxylate synthase [Weissella ceti]|uniref:Putative 2-succinyl-6-hydroxy-2,4-cyclohexadiene-1-carboxylate synthase n=1 Tax=Weissella ceti TaxID=759620 RepID=A0ABT3E2B2_9LACO|nr:2-succinyl-6-hydroxy-2,4-cyclohexadiene-1-carboxylate synthase [Weissella ceti]MCW0952544.1 2-succinyl-6-hydroxy-2,4-cyclohexadiene-1-carboxylate synthase [Weissella ceti]QVK11790.1 2-succinyl-6-hydroxy-2,4-cyclohexadiene-1-carboxylate synthase [Weissella ceti]
MDKQVSVQGYPYDVQIVGNGQPTWVFLHGFLGSQTEFQHIEPHGTRIYVNLKGFGVHAPIVETNDMAVEKQVAELHELLQTLELTHVNLVGYSMGARLALSYALIYPELIEQLILESGTAGLQTSEERAERRAKDERLAQRLETNGMADFVTMWENLPLFATQTELTDEVQQHVRQQRLRQQPANMAASLRAFGTGSMPNHWQNLATLTIPTTIITGSVDEKFTNLGQALVAEIPTSKQIVVPDVGHNVHLEAPKRFVELLNRL